MDSWLERLKESPVSRETVNIERFNNIRTSLSRKRSMMTPSVDLGSVNVNESVISTKPNTKQGFEVLKRMSPFKTSSKKRKSSSFDEDNSRSDSSQIKVRVLDTESCQDLHFLGRVRESNLLVGWFSPTSKSARSKTLIYEDKKCERVDLNFYLDFSKENLDSCGEYSVFILPDKVDQVDDRVDQVDDRVDQVDDRVDQVDDDQNAHELNTSYSSSGSDFSL